MSTTDSSLGPARLRARRSPQREYRVIEMALLPLFLALAALSFLLPRETRVKVPGLDSDGSLFKRARHLAATTLPFAFMG
jgi:hypothetical protein